MPREKDEPQKYGPDFVKELLEAAKKPPAKTFDNFEDLMRWLEADFDGHQ
jgi:hypothetical protein